MKITLCFSLVAPPLLLLESIIGTTVGTLVGARIDRRKGKEPIVRNVIGWAFLAIVALVAALAFLTIYAGVSGTSWLHIILGIAGIPVSVGLCIAGWWVRRHKKQAEGGFFPHDHTGCAGSDSHGWEIPP